MPKVPRSPSSSHLASLSPDKVAFDQDSLLWRVYFRGGNHPTLWGDFRYVGPLSSRFDHHVGNTPTIQVRSIMYAAESVATCIAETFQGTRVINRWHKEPWLVGFQTAKPITLLDLTGSFSTRAGASMGLMTGARSVGRNWARGFYDAYPTLAGLCYPSSMHANEPAIALTDRAETLGVLPPRPIFHRALGDPSMLGILKQVARDLEYALN
jgi:hypothetical protein